MVFNSTSRIVPLSVETGRLAVILPHSSKVLFESDIDAKIEKTKSHLAHLNKAQSHRNTHGGKRFRARQISLREQIDSASKKLALLTSAKKTNFDGSFKLNLAASRIYCSALRDVNQSILAFRLHAVLTCSKDTLHSTIEDVASYVSNIWATFPQMKEEERAKFRKNGAWLAKMDDEILASKEVCEQFEVTLKRRIIDDLNQEKMSDCRIFLHTSYSPSDVLYDIAKQFFYKNPEELGHRFPYKSRTDFFLTDNKTKLHIGMSFKAPSIR